MALSSLQAQLAALNSGGAGAGNEEDHHHPGSTFASSRRHEDGIVGRGMHYSAHQGFAVDGRSTKFKASIVYETAREAADVSLAVLRENALSSLEILTHELVPGIVWFASSSAAASATYLSITDESKDLPQNQLQQVLLALSVLFHDAACQSDCLNVLEYLLRRYRLERQTANLLWVFWPHAEHHPTLFNRVLQLVDLATDQSYVWLRPYCITPTPQKQRQKGEEKSTAVTTAAKPNIPPRSLVAQHMTKNTSWLRRLVQSTQTVAARRNWCGSSSNSSSNALLQRGIRHYSSWSAALIVEGLSWLATASATKTTTADREAVVRTLLPAILSACSGGGNSSPGSNLSSSATAEGWSAWGCVVVSAVAERMELTPATITLLVNKTLQGVSSPSSIDDQADVVTTVLSVLIPPPSRPQQPNTNTYLPLLNGKWLGCALSDESFDELLMAFGGSSISNSSLSSVLGYLYLARRIVVAPLVATIFTVALRRRCRRVGPIMDDDDDDTTHILTCLESLIQQERLLPMWKDTRMDLVASLASYVLSQGVKETPEDTNQHNKILMALHAIDPHSCERGIARAMQDDEIDSHGNYNKDCLVKLLKGIVDTDNDRMADVKDDNNKTHLLPPRVALEHADPAVRLEAVQRLRSIMSKTISKGKMDDDDDDSTDSEEEEEVETNMGESLMESLLRRWSTDENVSVALASSKAVCERMDRLLMDDDNSQRLGELVLSGLYRWMDKAALQQPQLSSEMQDLMKLSHTIAGSVVRELGLHGAGGDSHANTLFQLIMEYLVTQLESNDELLAQQTAESVARALSETNDYFKDKDAKEMVSCARSLIIKNYKVLHTAHKLYTKVVGPNPEAETQIRRRCILIVLSEISRALGAGQDVSSFSDDLLPLCLLLLHDRQNKRDDSGLVVIRSCLEFTTTTYAGKASSVPDLLVTLSQIPSQCLYLKVIQPAALLLLTIPKDNNGNKVSAIAVLLEAAARPDTPALSCERLILLATEIITSGDEVSPVLGLVPGLAFLEHPVGRVRAATLRLLQAVGDCLEHDKEWSHLSFFCANLKEVKSSSSLDANGLSKLLSSCVRDSKNGARGLLRLCVLTIASVGPTTTVVDTSIFSKGWMSFGKGAGGGRVAAVILDAMELAGEDSFPLKLRFDEAGKIFLEGCLTIGSGVPPTMLLETAIRMLKGTTVQDPQIVISSGPRAGGGRTRTYSVGRLDGVTVIDPYPSDMVKCVTNILSGHNKNECTQQLASLVVKGILSSKSWCELVFTKLSNKCRQSIASELLLYIDSTADTEDTNRAFSMLQLQPTDFRALLKDNEENTASLSILCDFIRANCSRIRVLPGVSDMVMELFNMLGAFSVYSDSKDGVDIEKEFVTQSILVTLSLLWRTEPDLCRIKLDKKKFKKCASILLSLFGGDNKPTCPYLKPFHSKAAALSLLSEMCADCPELFMDSLVSVMKSSMPRATSSENTAVPREVNETLSVVLSLCQAHGPSCGFHVGNLFQGFIEAAQKYHEAVSSQLLQEFSKVLIAKYAGDDNSAGLSVASLMASFLAIVAHENDGNPVPLQGIRLVVHVVDSMPPSLQMSCLHMLLEHSKAIISTFLRESSQGPVLSSADTSIFASLPCPKELSLIAATGALMKTAPSAYNEVQKQCILNFMNATLQAFCDVLLLDKLQKYVNKGDAGSSALSLHVWQNLLVATTSIQHDLHSKRDVERKSCLVVATRLLKESQQMFAELLPLHTFLASVSSLIKDNTTDIIQECALRLVASHAAEIDPDSPEAELFAEIVPVISNLLEQKVASMNEDTSTVVHQASMLALAHIAHATRKTDLALEHLSCVIKQCTKLLQKCPNNSNFNNISPSKQQLVCSIALCCAALVRTLGTRCMPSLPTLVKLLASSLGSVNCHVASNTKSGGMDKEAQVFQLSILRALVAVAETVPQVLPSHLPMLLTERVVLSSSLQTIQSEKSDAVIATSEELQKRLSSNIPSRVLIPAASRAADLCSTSEGLKALLFMTKTSIDQASSREAASHRDNLLKLVIKACEYEESISNSAVLLSASKDLLLALVMKLSEAQLRQVFAGLQDWQGDLDIGNPNWLSTRRHAFWSLLAELSKDLGTIFLPFLGTVMNDAKGDLDLAAVKLAGLKTRRKTTDGQKRRRLDNSVETDVPCNETSIQCIKPLLLCLELSLKADARAGGNWIRSEENQWFNLLLNPFRQLLHCPVNGTLDLILGSTDGNVVSCLTALAAAAGNEQLWKPLNHAVLEACGDELHSGVRKAGIFCLISLMESLGEEYMVLLPECLPVLSELLEDTEEEIASLARECVTLAEELIGESLEESLR